MKQTLAFETVLIKKPTCKDTVLREYLYSIPHLCLGHCNLKVCGNNK